MGTWGFYWILDKSRVKRWTHNTILPLPPLWTETESEQKMLRFRLFRVLNSRRLLQSINVHGKQHRWIIIRVCLIIVLQHKRLFFTRYFIKIFHFPMREEWVFQPHREPAEKGSERVRIREKSYALSKFFLTTQILQIVSPVPSRFCLYRWIPSTLVASINHLFVVCSLTESKTLLFSISSVYL